jgi:hypothetical protein
MVRMIVPFKLSLSRHPPRCPDLCDDRFNKAAQVIPWLNPAVVCDPLIEFLALHQHFSLDAVMREWMGASGQTIP